MSSVPDGGGLVRSRLMSRFAETDSYRVAWVVAPAGSGKSRLLAHLAQAFPGPVAWCGTPDPIPRTESAIVRWIWESLSLATGRPDVEGSHQADPRPPSTVDELVEWTSEPGAEAMVAIDDIHLIEGLPSESALSELISRIPPRLRIVMASRVHLDLDLSRVRVSGQLIEMGTDDLRFRTWEVEELFRDVYEDPLLPEDVASLAHRTAGWAAYLQLFFLATARKPHAERRRLLSTLSGRNRLVSEYLGRHALAELSYELRDFLIRTSVLRRPVPQLCDELLGTGHQSEEMLAELAKRQLFTERLEDDAYRYHAVLLSYLDSKLVETIGANEARAQHRRAGGLLEREGWMDDALAAYTKAEDWDSVARLVGHPGLGVNGIDGAGIDALPPAVVESDSLLLIVKSHGEVARGALIQALASLREAERIAPSQMIATRSRAERDRVVPWVDRDRLPGDDWTGIVCQAARDRPQAAQAKAALIEEVEGRFAEGCAAFLSGDVLTALRLTRFVANHPDASNPMSVGAALVSSAASVVCGRPPSSTEVSRIREEIEACRVPWLERLGRAALLGGTGSATASLEGLADACDREGDKWGSALVAVLAGFRTIGQDVPESMSAFERAGRMFDDLGARVAQSTCIAYAAVAAVKSGFHQRAAELAAVARTLATSHDVPGALGVISLVVWALTSDPREWERARGILTPLGSWAWHVALLEVPSPSPREQYGSSDEVGPVPRADPVIVASSAVSGDGSSRLRCFGSYSLILGGRRVEEESAKPMERALLHLLSMQAGDAVHREALVEALWPEAEPEAGRHRLQVAVSSVRRLLSAAGVDGQTVLARDRESYRLSLPEGADVDVWRVERAAREASSARRVGDAEAEERSLFELMGAYAGPLLADDGPVDWLADARRTFQSVYTDSAARLATLRREGGDLPAAAAAARAGLAVDRYRDELWKLLIGAADEAGNHAEAEQERRNYEAVLAELGV